MKEYVIVTGGSRGIGNNIVKMFLNKGVSVIYTYKNTNKEYSYLQELAEKNSVDCKAYKIDHSSSDEVEKFYNYVLDMRVKIKGIVNNAGIKCDNLVINMSNEEWKSVLDVNLTGAFYMIRSFSKILIEQREGFIINISSTTGIDGCAGASNYAASKGGLIAFAKSIGHELAPFGIRNYIIAQGYVDTEMIENLSLKKIRKNIQLGRPANPDEVAELVGFLAEGKQFIQNSVIISDGGSKNR